MAIETIEGNLYDYPKYYDVVFGSDWKAEFDFLRACFGEHSGRAVHRVFEPACGTGRLLVKLAQAGYEVSGNDLNQKAVDYCNRRLARQGFLPSVTVGDMADFRLKRKADAAFCLINSFRHLPTEQSAVAHLHCVANALAKGGLYVLGLHLTPTAGQPLTEESWSGRRGNLAVMSRLRTTDVDLRRRRETVRMVLDVYTPTRTFRLNDELAFRTYTARQMAKLIDQASGLELAGTYDFAYRISEPVEVGPGTQDVVFVLRKL